MPLPSPCYAGRSARASRLPKVILRLQTYPKQTRRWSFAAVITALMVCLMMSVLAAPAHAQPNGGSAPATDVVLAAARKQLDDIRKNLPDQTDDAALLKQRSNALEIQSKADATVEQLTPQLTSVAARLSELGSPPEGAKEAPDVAAQRMQLDKTNRALDAQIKLAKLLALDAGQTAELISAQRRVQFQAKLGERRDSFLASQFWSEFHEEFPRDLDRVDTLGQDLWTAMKQTPLWGWLVVVLAAAAVIAARLWMGRLLIRITASRVPPGRLRRSVVAIAEVILSVATPGLIALLIRTGLDWRSQLSDGTAALLSDLVITVCFGGYAYGLARALLSVKRPSWRLPPIPDKAAERIRWLPSWLGVLVVFVWLAERLPVLLDASLTTTITMTCIVAVVLIATLAGILVAGRRARDAAAADIHPGGSGTPQAPSAPVSGRPFWVSAIVSTVWVVLGLSFASLLAGYVAFGSFLVKQVLWSGVVLSTAYLLSTLIEDGFSTLLGSASRDAEPGKPSTREQAAVLLSGVGRLCVGLLAIVLLLAPFGEGPMDLVQRFDQLRKGLAIGEAQIRPGALLQALIVLAVSLLSIRILKRWLSNRYLPTTELDPGMQLSAATLFGYAGFVMSIGLSLSAAGIGLERVAWIASALSVGIGFGLQAVVQNFVSGLILLAERPVKVGDWVSLGGVEGDILRINVRATEIQMGDRSTVIVPNSEFVTKTVRNVTRSDPLGLVQIKLPMPLSTNPEAVRSLMLEVFCEHEGVLESPAPNVFLDGIEGGHLVYNAKGYVNSPRSAYGVRSALLFEVLKRLHDAGLEVSSPPTMLLASATPTPLSDDLIEPAPPKP